MQLVSKSKIGRQVLSQANWNITPVEYYLPHRNLSVFFAAFSFIPPIETSPEPVRASWSPSDSIFHEILSKLYDLTNSVIAQASSKSLLGLREEYKEYFKRKDVYESIAMALANLRYTFSLASIRFIYSLFSFSPEDSALIP
jgi:hypothetical protein